MSLAIIGAALVLQQSPMRVVELAATLAGKPYGTVTYSRGTVAGKGMERRVVLQVQDEGSSYKVEEVRSYSAGGVPTRTVRTYTEGERQVTVTLTYKGTTATVVFAEDGESDAQEETLEQEGATLTDPSQFWFFDGVPSVGTKATFWEYSLDANEWQERTVTYTGVAELKVGEATVKAHRISINKDTNFYVDDAGMPYKSSQETPAGTLTLVRTSIKAGGG